MLRRSMRTLLDDFGVIAEPTAEMLGQFYQVVPHPSMIDFAKQAWHGFPSVSFSFHSVLFLLHFYLWLPPPITVIIISSSSIITGTIVIICEHVAAIVFQLLIYFASSTEYEATAVKLFHIICLQTLNVFQTSEQAVCLRDSEATVLSVVSHRCVQVRSLFLTSDIGENPDLAEGFFNFLAQVRVQWCSEIPCTGSNSFIPIDPT